MNLQKFENAEQSIPPVQMGPSQVSSLANLMSRIFHDEPNFEYLVPDEAARSAVLPSLFRSAIRAGLRYGEIHTTENHDGVAVWIRPERNVPLRRMLRMSLAEAPLNLGLEQYRARYMRLSASVEEVRKHLAPSAHWYLMFLGSDASVTEKIIGQALMQSVLLRADSAGMSCYLETFSERRLAFYKNHGFRITGAGQIPDGGPNFWAMARRP